MHTKRFAHAYIYLILAVVCDHYKQLNLHPLSCALRNKKVLRPTAAAEVEALLLGSASLRPVLVQVPEGSLEWNRNR